MHREWKSEGRLADAFDISSIDVSNYDVAETQVRERQEAVRWVAGQQKQGLDSGYHIDYCGQHPIRVWVWGPPELEGQLRFTSATRTELKREVSRCYVDGWIYYSMDERVALDGERYWVGWLWKDDLGGEGIDE